MAFSFDAVATERELSGTKMAHLAEAHHMTFEVPVFPCNRDKMPMVQWGDTSIDEDSAVEGFFETHKRAPLWGMPTGARSGINVLDFDFRDIPEDVWDLVPYTPWRVETKKGCHFYYRASVSLKNDTCAASKIDVRSDGGYAVVVGEHYKHHIEPTWSPDINDLPVLTAEHVRAVRARFGRQAGNDQQDSQDADKALIKAMVAGTIEPGMGIKEGGRNHALNSFAYQLALTDISRDEFDQKVDTFCVNANYNERDEILKTVESAFGSGIRERAARGAAGASAAAPSAEAGVAFDFHDASVPLADRLESAFVTITGEMIDEDPVPHDCVLGCFPVGVSTACVAMGGVGKSQWAIRKAIEAVIERDEDVVILSAEDNAMDYQAKLHNAVVRGAAEFGAHFDRKRVASKIHVLELKGTGIQFVQSEGRLYIPSRSLVTIGDLIEKRCGKVCLLVFETLSRLVGDEDAGAIAPFVTGTDYLSQRLNCAGIVIHHTGKVQGRSGVVDIYSGRGSSALGDNTRSFFVLTPLDTTDKATILDELMPIDRRAAKYFKAHHVRNSFRIEQAPEHYRIVAGNNGPWLKKVEVAEGAEAEELRTESLSASILSYIRQQGGTIPKARLLAEKDDKCPGNKHGNRDVVEALISQGRVIEEVVREEGKTGAGKKWITIVEGES